MRIRRSSGGRSSDQYERVILMGAKCCHPDGRDAVAPNAVTLMAAQRPEDLRFRSRYYVFDLHLLSREPRR